LTDCPKAVFPCLKTDAVLKKAAIPADTSKRGVLHQGKPSPATGETFPLRGNLPRRLETLSLSGETFPGDLRDFPSQGKPSLAT